METTQKESLFAKTQALKTSKSSPFTNLARVARIADLLQNEVAAAARFGFDINGVILSIHVVNAVVGDEQLRLRFFRNLS